VNQSNNRAFHVGAELRFLTVFRSFFQTVFWEQGRTPKTDFLGNQSFLERFLKGCKKGFHPFSAPFFVFGAFFGSFFLPFLHLTLLFPMSLPLILAPTISECIFIDHILRVNPLVWVRAFELHGLLAIYLYFTHFLYLFLAYLLNTNVCKCIIAYHKSKGCNLVRKWREQYATGFFKQGWWRVSR
jgi:hypothetical protein